MALIIVLLLAPILACGQESNSQSRLGLSFGMGYFKSIPGERFRSTGNGWQVDIVARYAVKPKVWLGAGFLWGATPSVDAPEYDVLKPLDHPIWFETSQFFLDLRYEPLREHSAILSPYFGGWMGWSKEFSEYSGPTVKRSGPLISGNGGVTIHILRNISLDVSMIFSMIRLGDAEVFDEVIADTSVSGQFFGLKSGLDIWF